MGASADRAALASAVAAFAAMPAVVAYALPIGLGAASGRGWTPWGLVVVGAGSAVLARTVIDFFTHGHGTLAPWDPPRRLVTSGLFAWCRNPMYLGVLTTVTGWAVTFRSPAVGLTAAAMAAAFHLRVVLAEERWMSEVFPDHWPAYREQVPRWVPRRPRATSRGAS